MTTASGNSAGQDQVAIKGEVFKEGVLPVHLRQLQMVLTVIALGSVLLLAGSGQVEAKDDAPLNPEAKAVRVKLEKRLKGLTDIDLMDEFVYYRLVRQSGFGIRQTLDDRRTKMIINEGFDLYEVHFAERKITYFKPVGNRPVPR
jgi:hypothetical protein